VEGNIETWKGMREAAVFTGLSEDQVRCNVPDVFARAAIGG
jgi:hypothetical protein